MTSADAEKPLLSSNKLRHSVLIFFDLLCVVMVCILYDDIQKTLMKINNEADIVRFGNRDGFFIIGIGFPILHLLNIVGYFCTDFFKKYQTSLNYLVIGLIVVLFSAGFVFSSLLKSRAENAGYVYCWYISGSGALAKTLVYTKDAQLCKDLSAKARAERTRR